MPYDEKLEGRVRAVLEADGVDYVLKYMFGGVAFMLRGHMAVGIVKDDLMVRVGSDAHEAALAEPHARPMDFAGKPMRTMVYVSPAGTGQNAGLARWVRAGVAHAASQPVKSAPTAKKAPPTAKKAPPTAKKAPPAAKKAPPTAKKAPARSTTRAR